MNSMRKVLLTACGVLFWVTGPAAAAEVVVSPGNLHGWQVQSSGGSTLNFEMGPVATPCGAGSAEFRVDPTGETAAQLRNPNYQGVKLTSLTALSYSTYVEQNSGGLNNSAQTVYVLVDVDLDGNLATMADRDLLFFEPAYQSPTYFPSNPQADVAIGLWQNWDALNGGWWSLDATAGAGPGTNVKPLSEITDVYPNASIVNGTTGGGGVRLVAGFGGPDDWGNFIGNADCFTIQGDTYDFETGNDTDGDGIPDDQDACPMSDLRPFVDVNGNGPENGQTSIPNTDPDGDGCTIQDEVNHCRETAQNHGQYVRCIYRLANDLYAAGIITRVQRNELRSQAGHSGFGP